MDDAPWLRNEEWAAGKIRSQTKSVAIFVWVLALLWNGFLWPVLALVWGDPDKTAMIKIVAVFCLVGVLLLFWALRETAAWFRFGTSIFELTSIPGLVGGALEGRIRTRLKKRPTSPVQLTLSCSRRVTTTEIRDPSERTRGVSSPRERTCVTTEPQWRGGCKVPPESLSREPDGLTIPVRIAIPSGVPGSDDSDPDDRIVWTLGATADLPGVDFGAAFSVPVFETRDSRHDLTQEMIDEAAEAQGLLSQPPDPGASWAPPLLVRWNERGGVEYTFRPATSLKVAVGVSLLTVGVCAGTAWLWVWLEEAGPFALIPAIFGGLLLLATAVVWTFKSRVILEGETMTIRKSLVGIPRTWKIPFSDIRTIRVQRDLVEGLDEKDLDWEIVIDRTSEVGETSLGASFAVRADAVAVADEIEGLVF